jgi:hypothetical protein
VEQAVNSAEAINRGFEVALSYKEMKSMFKYNISANVSAYKNEISKLNDPIFLLTYNGSHLIRIEEGMPVSQFYGYVSDGIFRVQEELDALNENSPTGYYQNNDTQLGDVKFKDFASRDEEGRIVTTPDGRVDDADRTYIGNPLPELTFGLNVSLNYKAFDMTMSWSGVYGNELYNANRVHLESSMDQRNKLATMLNRYSEENPAGTMPRAISADPNLNSRNSDRFIEDGSYAKLRNIELGYTIPSIISKKANISSARIFISAQNLITITNYSGYDPDVGKYLLSDASGLMMGFDNSFYPQARTLMAGVNLNF